MWNIYNFTVVLQKEPKVISQNKANGTIFKNLIKKGGRDGENDLVFVHTEGF